MTYRFEVIGDPVSQGSKQAFVRGGRAMIVEAGTSKSRARHAQWRADVCLAAQTARGDAVSLEGPVSVDLTFWLAVVKSDPYRTMHHTAPDIDKLARLVLDSLTNSGIIHDDSLVWSLSVNKFYAIKGHWTGVDVQISDDAGAETARRGHLKAVAKAERKVKS